MLVTGSEAKSLCAKLAKLVSPSLSCHRCPSQTHRFWPCRSRHHPQMPGPPSSLLPSRTSSASRRHWVEEGPATSKRAHRYNGGHSGKLAEWLPSRSLTRLCAFAFRGALRRFALRPAHEGRICRRYWCFSGLPATAKGVNQFPSPNKAERDQAGFTCTQPGQLPANAHATSLNLVEHLFEAGWLRSKTSTEPCLTKICSLSLPPLLVESGDAGFPDKTAPSVKRPLQLRVNCALPVGLMWANQGDPETLPHSGTKAPALFALASKSGSFTSGNQFDKPGQIPCCGNGPPLFTGKGVHQLVASGESLVSSQPAKGLTGLRILNEKFGIRAFAFLAVNGRFGRQPCRTSGHWPAAPHSLHGIVCIAYLLPERTRQQPGWSNGLANTFAYLIHFASRF